jgi:eukaryotic-like serine/threonine-protein kinase
LTLKAGTAVGPYAIVAPLGAGGMGEVYRAFDRKLNREVALKILSADLASSAEHLRRFEQEARAASALNHPNIISIYDIGRAESLAYIVMELVDGQDVRTLTAEDTLNLKQILRIACKVADGLAAAHDRGIVHRDLKPENVMVSSDGFVKILDFGLAKLVTPWGAEDTTLPHTTPGAVFGTVGYMSPEQASGKPTDFHTDQFSLAVILYELISRRRPFERPTAAETMAAIIREQPEPLSKLDKSVPPQLERIIERCLEKNPRERYGSTRDLARDLREVRDSLTTPSHPGHRSSVPEPAAIHRISPVVAVVAAAALLAGIGYVAWQNYHVPEPSRTVKSLAIMPFRDLNGTADGQLLADGVADTIGSRLIRANAMRIASAVDAGDRSTPREIAEQYHADLLLRGSVQRVGDQIRVSYALVHPDGSQISADSITGAAGQLFAVEDMVAERVLQMLRVPAKARQKPSTRGGLDRAADQATYVEAVGLLSRAKDQKSVDVAISKLESLLTNARDSAMVNGTLARALVAKYAMGRQPNVLDDASLYAERAVQLDPNVVEAHLALGTVRATTGHLPEALESYNRALVLQPNSAEAFLGLGVVYDASGRAADAERAFESSIALRPDWPIAFNRYGTFCMSRGRYEKAAELFKRVIHLTPDASRGYANLGAALQSMGRYDEALAIYEKAIAVAPNAVTYSNLGTMRFFLGRYADACSAFEKATQLSPNDYILWANLGDSYRWTPARRGDAAPTYEKAVTAARSALAVNQHDAVAHAVIAGCRAKTDRAAEAASEIHTALQIDPTNRVVLYDAALVAQLHGDSDAAISWLQRAVANGYAAGDLKNDPELTALRQKREFIDLTRSTNKQN